MKIHGGKAVIPPSGSRTVAVGHRKFIEEVKAQLGIKAMGRRIRRQEGTMLYFA